MLVTEVMLWDFSAFAEDITLCNGAVVVFGSEYSEEDNMCFPQAYITEPRVRRPEPKLGNPFVRDESMPYEEMPF